MDVACQDTRVQWCPVTSHTYIIPLTHTRQPHGYAVLLRMLVRPSSPLPRATMGLASTGGQVNSRPVCSRYLLASCVLAAAYVPCAMGEHPDMEGTKRAVLPDNWLKVVHALPHPCMISRLETGVVMGTVIFSFSILLPPPPPPQCPPPPPPPGGGGPSPAGSKKNATAVSIAQRGNESSATGPQHSPPPCPASPPPSSPP